MKDTIKISAETLLDELLWYATRYCIGRRSYVTGIARNWNRFAKPEYIKDIKPIEP